MNGLTFHKLELRNFVSYGNNITELNLNFIEPTIIVGKNYDVMGDTTVESNGSGKTTLVNAICYSLFDEPLIPVNSKNDLINVYNKKDLMVSLLFSINNQYYKITRYRKNKSLGGTGVKILKYIKNDLSESEDITPDSINNSNKFIENLLGITYESFTRVVLFSATYSPFLSLPSTSTSGANQKDILEEVLGITIISQKAEILKEQIKNANNNLNNDLLIYHELENQKKDNEQMILLTEEKSKQFEQNRQLQIDSLREQLEKIESIDFKEQLLLLEKLSSNNSLIKEKQTVLNDKNKNLSYQTKLLNQFNDWERNKKEKLQSYRTTIGKYASTDFDAIEQTITNISQLKQSMRNEEQEKNDINRQISNKDRIIDALKNELKDLHKSICPYCKQSFTNKEIITTKSDEYKQEELNVNALKEKFSNLEIKINELKSELSTLESSDFPFKTINDLLSEKHKFENAVDNYENLKKEKNPYADDIQDSTEISKIKEDIKLIDIEIDTLSKENVSIAEKSIFKSITELTSASESIKSIKEKIAIIKKQENNYIEIIANLKTKEFNTDLATKIATQESEIYHMDVLYKLLTKKDSFLRKNIIKNRLTVLNQKLKEFLADLNVSYFVEFIEDMSIKVKNHNEEISVSTLSTGQKSRINLALAFAFRHVLQLNTKRVNFCLLDETLDIGLSTNGIQQAVKMIKKIAYDYKISMLLITHKEEANNFFNSKIEIELKNGFSRIVYSDTGVNESSIDE